MSRTLDLRAAVLETVGQGLAVEDLLLDGPAPGEVLIEVEGCGVCHTDLHVLKGEVGFPLPAVMGHEASGRVVETSAGVDHVRVGDPVVCTFIMPCQRCVHWVRGHQDLCSVFFERNRLGGHLLDGTTRIHRHDGADVSMYSMGGFASHAVVPASAVFRAPDGIDLATASLLGCSFLTAFGAVRNVARVQPGERVAVVAAGGVGQALVSLAATFGANQIIAIDLDDQKLALARDLGATDTVNAAEVDAIEAVAELTGGAGVDVAFEALGSPRTFATTVGIVGDGGRAVLVGIAPAGVEGSVEITRLVRRKIQILGSYGGRPGTDMPTLVALAEQGRLPLDAILDRTYPLADVDQAFRDLDAARINGRAVVRP